MANQLYSSPRCVVLGPGYHFTKYMEGVSGLYAKTVTFSVRD